MAKHAVRRPRSAWAPVAVAVAAGAALLGSGAGVYAMLQAVATGSQTVNTGTLTLNEVGNGTFGTAVPSLAPGDLVHRFVTVTNTGSLSGTGLTLGVSGTSTGTNELVNGTAATALRITVSECPVAWTPTGMTNGVQEGNCGGNATGSNIVSTAVNSASVPVATTSLPVGTVAPTVGARYFRLSIRVPDGNEISVDGVPPTTTVQGKSASLTFTFTENQRTGTVSSS